MVVILTDGRYQLQRRPHPFPLDAHGVGVPTLPVPVGVPLPGAATLRGDLTWSLRLDPGHWTVEAGDRVSDGTRSWTVTGEPRLIRNPVAGDVDYIAATAVLDPPEVP